MQLFDILNNRQLWLIVKIRMRETSVLFFQKKSELENHQLQVFQKYPRIDSFHERPTTNQQL